MALEQFGISNYMAQPTMPQFNMPQADPAESVFTGAPQITPPQSDPTGTDKGSGWIDRLFGGGKVFGMTPEKFSTMVGQAAYAIGGGKTIGARLGMMAAQMGAAQMKMIAAKNQLAGYSNVAKDMISNVGNINSMTPNGLSAQKPRLSSTQDMYQAQDQSKSILV